MKKIEIRIVLIFMLLTISSSIVFSIDLFNKDTLTTDFSLVDRVVSWKVNQFGVSKLLIVLDIDNTILTSDTDLGTDIWYSWQMGRLEEKPEGDQKVKCLYNDAIGLLYELNAMKLTEEKVPEYIKGWQQKGITVIALTSRDPRTRSATERELIKHKIDFSVTGLRRAGEDLPAYRDSIPREYTYMKGIMMTAGMDKGVTLKYLLEKTGRSFESIVFVDDTEKNVLAVKGSFKNEPSIDLTNILYDKVVADRKKANGGVVITKAQANKMAADWNELNSMLNRLFPGRTKTECVSTF